MKRWKIFTLIIIIGVTSAAFVPKKLNDRNFEIAKNLDIFYTLFRELNTYYVDEIDPGKLIKKGITSMLESLDPYTNYIPESKVEDYKFMTTGEYGGVGAIISTLDEKAVVRQVYEGFPMDKAGVKPGDILLKINDVSVDDKSNEEISEIVKGSPGSKVDFLIKRPGHKQNLTKTVVRKKIHIPDVPYYGMLDEKTAYIKLSNFTKESSQSVREKFEQLKNEYNPEALVFDLRGNPGGLLREAVKIMGLFVPKGELIVKTKGRLDRWNQQFHTSASPKDSSIRIAVLVNGRSASASEIVAGTIQDLDRGIVIGNKTYGKGLVQATRDLSYGAKLKITAAKYYIPSGRCIQALDYSHRKDDGSVGQIPDSLISAYSTENGRKVYGGGGIRPDIKIKSHEPSRFTKHLLGKNAIFDYITQFTLEHDTIAPPEKFTFNQDQFKAFKAYIQNTDSFEYRSKSQEQYEKLLKTAKKEDRYKLAQDEFKALERAIEKNLSENLNKYKDEIRDIIRTRIVGRYYYRSGELQASLNNNAMIDTSLKVLRDSEKYTAYLQP